MRTKDQINVDYTRLCSELGQLQFQFEMNQSQLLAQLRALGDEMNMLIQTQPKEETNEA